MPNHVTNVVVFSADESRIKQILNAVAYDNKAEYPEGVNTIDFNKIITAPDNIYQGELGPQERKLYGKNNWYDWNIRYWGTKWNSYGYADSTPSDNKITFLTAWSAPSNVIEKLSLMYPDVLITHSWADEDIGQNCGRRIYLEGECIDEFFPESNKDCVDFACDVIGYTPAELDLVESVSGTQYINIDNKMFELADVCGIPVLYSEDAISLTDIPKGMYLYHLRQPTDSSESYCAVDRNPTDKWGGSIITKKPFDFRGQSSIALDSETSPSFLGEEFTFREYMEDSFLNVWKQYEDNIDTESENCCHPVLIGSCSEEVQELHSIREVAEFITKHGKYDDVTITEEDGTPFLDTFGVYINRIADLDYREKLLEVLVPMQRDIERYAFEGSDDIDDGGDGGMTLGGM